MKAIIQSMLIAGLALGPLAGAALAAPVEGQALAAALAANSAQSVTVIVSIMYPVNAGETGLGADTGSAIAKAGTTDVELTPAGGPAPTGAKPKVLRVIVDANGNVTAAPGTGGEASKLTLSKGVYSGVAGGAWSVMVKFDAITGATINRRAP